MTTTVAAVLVAALLTAASVPAALASTGPGGSVGCTGVTCYVALWQYIHLSGNAVDLAGGNGTQITLPPPPCYMEPMFSGPELYQLWKEDGGLPGGGGFPFGKYVPQIKLYKDSNAGYWWERVINLQVAGNCGLPLLAWVTNGAAPPLPAVPEIDLADYAYNHMKLPSPVLTFNPAARSYVSLPTYVWAKLRLTLPATVTATLGTGPEAESATVTATPGPLLLSASGGARVYHAGCTTFGSAAPNPPQNAGPGTIPDCGVTFTAPGTGNMITGSLVWTPVSAGHTFPFIHTSASKAVIVDEIQSLNG